MKVITILGTRPEIIRLSRIIPNLDNHCEHIVVHTGQNYTQELSDVFFKQLKIREPDMYLQVANSNFSLQVGWLLIKIGKIFTDENPDRILILGDTNSGLSAIVAKRMGIPVYHMEAGNRCFDDRVPEEVNRRIIDHSSDILMPYTERSRQNLLREGIAGNRIYVIGNPINEVVHYFANQIQNSRILNHLKLKTGAYFLVSAHRFETINDKISLSSLIYSCSCLVENYKDPVIFSLHPHTADRMKDWDIGSSSVRFHKPFGFFDFIKLEKNAKCVITDSGTVQEECSIFQVPNVTVRYTTERPETIECGSNIISGVESDDVLRAVSIAVTGNRGWEPPTEYSVTDVSSKVVKIVLGY